MYGPKRQFKRKDAGPNDEKSRVRLTLLEYGNRNNIIVKSDIPKLKNASNSKSVEDEGSEQSAEDIHQNEVYIWHFLSYILLRIIYCCFMFKHNLF